VSIATARWAAQIAMRSSKKPLVFPISACPDRKELDAVVISTPDHGTHHRGPAIEAAGRL
jgi:hypothetical protein